MNYPSGGQVPPIKDAEFADRIKTIHENLEKYRQCGFVDAYDGLSLRYHYFLCENPVGTVVIIHGYTEFSIKYEEIIYYFLEAGYHCFIFDERSHGHSGSGVEDRNYNHVESFDEYAKDLNTIMESVVRPNCGGGDIYLYTHSMGGAIALWYLHDYKPSDVKKAILSSPLVVPKMVKNIPVPIVKMALSKYAREDGWNAPFRHTGHFNPNPDFTTSHDCSKARFDHNLALRLSDPNYQNSGSTNSWLRECLRVPEVIPKKKYLSAIPQEILLMEAGIDNVVRTEKYGKVAKYLPNCTHSVYSTSRHSIYNSEDSVLVRYWNEVFEFLKK